MTALREKLARAIEDAELGYDLKLTSLVDGVSTYTLTYEGSVEKLEFGSYEEASEHLRNYRSELRATAALATIEESGMVIVPREATEEMIEAANDLDEDQIIAPIHDRMALLKNEGPAIIWTAMLSAAPKEPTS